MTSFMEGGMKIRYPFTVGLLSAVISGCASSPDRLTSDLGESKPATMALESPAPEKLTGDEISGPAVSTDPETKLVVHEQAEELPFAEYDIPLLSVSRTP